MKVNDILLEDYKPIFYCSYGMLTDPALMGDATKIGPVVIKHFEFELLQFANLLYSPGSQCYGALWQISERQLGELDQVEGYPFLYDRKTIPVYLDGKKIVAEAYFLRPDSRDAMAGTRPSRRYVAKLKRGYKHFGIPVTQIYDALEIAIQNQIIYPVR